MLCLFPSLSLHTVADLFILPLDTVHASFTLAAYLFIQKAIKYIICFSWMNLP